MLIKANVASKKWNGRTIGKGQLITSIAALSDATGLSKATIRRSIEKLAKSGEILRETTNRYSLITIRNYEKFQIGTFEQSSEQSSEQRLKNKEYKNERNNTTTKEPAKKLSLDRDGRMVADYFFQRFGGSNLSKMAATFINTALTSYSVEELMKVIDAAYNDPMVQNYNSRKSLSYILNMDRVATYLNNANK